MDIVVKYVDSAFEHSCTEADIRNAINTWLYDDIWDEAVDKHLLLGFDWKAGVWTPASTINFLSIEDTQELAPGFFIAGTTCSKSCIM
jgi:hypothetical protein